MAYKNFKICCGKAQSTVVPGSITASHSGSITTFISSGWQLNTEATMTGYHYTASCRLEDLIPRDATFSSLGIWNIQVTALTPINPTCTVVMGRVLSFEWDGGMYGNKSIITVTAVINYTQTVTTYTSETFYKLACNAANAGNDNGSDTISSGWTSELIGIRPVTYKHSKTMFKVLPDPVSNSNNTTITMNSFNLTGPASVMANKMITITPVGRGTAMLTVSFENASSTPTSGTYSYEYDYDWVRKETNLGVLKSNTKILDYINLADYVSVSPNIGQIGVEIEIYNFSDRTITVDGYLRMTDSGDGQDEDENSFDISSGDYGYFYVESSDGYDVEWWGANIDITATNASSMNYYHEEYI